MDKLNKGSNKMRYYQIKDTETNEQIILTTSDYSEDLYIYFNNNQDLELIKELEIGEFESSAADYYIQFGLN